MHLVEDLTEWREVVDLVSEPLVPRGLQFPRPLDPPEARRRPILGPEALRNRIERDFAYADDGPEIEEVPRFLAVVEHVPLVRKDLLKRDNAYLAAFRGQVRVREIQLVLFDGQRGSLGSVQVDHKLHLAPTDQCANHV